MKTSRILGLAAILIFVISYFLPAYENDSGFVCFGDCWEMLLGHDTKILSGGWFYYGGFVISNILFIGLAAALFVTQGRRKFSSVVSVIVFLHVLSWFVVPFISGKPSQVTDLKIGYYVWLMAYALLVSAHLWKKPAESLRSLLLACSAG
jgi:hypothetical protein